MTKQIETLFFRALDVLNLSLDAHRGFAPYRQMISAAESFLKDKNLRVLVYDDDPDAPRAEFAIRLKNRQFEHRPATSREKDESDVVWRVPTSYLEDLANNAVDYISHPMKINWNWLKARIGWDDKLGQTRKLQ
jgi:hypothetical protein